MVKTSGEDKSLTEFAIINKNTLSQSARGTYVKTVTIKFPGHEIIIIQQDRNKVIVSKTNHFILYLNTLIIFKIIWNEFYQAFREVLYWWKWIKFYS